MFAHHPPVDVIDNKNYDTTGWYYGQLVPMLQAQGVHLLLVGHAHAYERSFPLTGLTSGAVADTTQTDNQYNYTPGNHRVVQVIGGVGGRQMGTSSVEAGSGSVMAKATNFTTMPKAEYGFLGFDVTADHLYVRYVSADDGAVLDEFSIGVDKVGPTATLAAPLDDNGTDLDPTNGVVAIATAQNNFQIKVDDVVGKVLNDATVTGATITVRKGTVDLVQATDYSFAYNPTTDTITLMPLAPLGSTFGNGNYFITLSGGANKIQDTAGNQMSATKLVVRVDTTLAPTPQTFVAAGSPSWKYLDNGSNQGTVWREVNFNDAAWASGTAQLGYGEGDEATVVNCGPSAPACNSGNFITTYFRRTFTVSDPSQYQNLTVNLKRDDGAAVYLNGALVVRDNLPANVFFNTLASSDASDDGQMFLPFVTATSISGRLHPFLLTHGTNVLAVEVHQASTTSPDVSFDLGVSAIDVVAPKVVGVTIGSSCSCSDDDFHPDYKVPVGSGEQIRTIPVAAANQVKIAFSEAMAQSGAGELDAGDLTLTLASSTGTPAVVTGYVWDPATNTATWTIDDDSNPATFPYLSGQFVLQLSDTVTDVAGVRLDGDWTNPTSVTQGMGTSRFPSGDGVPTGSFAFFITLLPGDANRDNFTNLTDLIFVQSRIGTTGAGWRDGDFNGDGTVSQGDVFQLTANYGRDYSAWPGGGMLMAGGGGERNGAEALRRDLTDYRSRGGTELAPEVIDELLAWLDTLSG